MTRLPGARTREQDALALFDEGGLLVCLSAAQKEALPTDPELVDTALTTLVRSGEATPVPFGHALYEHLALGHAPPLAYAQVLALDQRIPDLRHTPDLAMLDAIDRALARVLDDPDQFREPERSRGLSLSELLRTNVGDDRGALA
jgi:hypothetical protein